MFAQPRQKAKRSATMADQSGGDAAKKAAVFKSIKEGFALFDRDKDGKIEKSKWWRRWVVGGCR